MFSFVYSTHVSSLCVESGENKRKRSVFFIIAFIQRGGTLLYSKSFSKDGDGDSDVMLVENGRKLYVYWCRSIEFSDI